MSNNVFFFLQLGPWLGCPTFWVLMKPTVLESMCTPTFQLGSLHIYYLAEIILSDSHQLLTIGTPTW